MPRRRAGRIALVLVALALGVAAPAPSWAQVAGRPEIAPTREGRTHRITLTDGSQLVGRIISVDSVSVQFESSLGVTTIPLSAIVQVVEERPGEMRDGRFFFPNPNDTRLLFAPTGRMLEKGEGYLSDFWIFFPGVAGGVTNNFTFGGGMSILPGIGLDKQLYYVTPKVGVVRGPRFNAAVGALLAFLPVDGGHDAGILYGVGTWGRVDASFTAGVGYGFVDGTLANQPFLMFGGETRAAPRLSLVTENYSLPGGAYTLSGGVRFLSRDISVDLAIATIGDGGDSFCCVPLLGFMWKWQ